MITCTLYVGEINEYSFFQFDEGPAFSVSNAIEIRSSFNTVKKCLAGFYGGVYNLMNTTLYDQSNIYDFNFGFEGGNIHSQNSRIVIKDCVYTNHYANEGGIISSIGFIDLELHNVQITNSTAFGYGGVMNIKELVY